MGRDSQMNRDAGGSKRLSRIDREKAVRFASKILPVAPTQYDAASQVMRHCEMYAPVGVPLTRRVAMKILADARTRLNADLDGVCTNCGHDVLWKVRDLYAKALAGNGGNLQHYHWRTLTTLLELEHAITQDTRPPSDSSADIGRVEFVIVDPANPAGSPADKPPETEPTDGDA